MLFVLRFKVSELTIQFVQSVLLFLDNLVALAHFHSSLSDGFFLDHEKVLNVANSLIIVVNFCSKDGNSLVLSVKFFVESQSSFSKSCQFLVGIMAALFLFCYKTFLIWNFFSQVKIDLIINAWLLSQTCEFSRGNCNFSLNDTDLFNDFHLLIFSCIVIILKAIKFFDKSVNFRSVNCNFFKTITLNFLLFELNLLVLFLKVSKLFLKSSEISLSTS